MATGGPELLDDPLAQELLRSRIPARLSYTWTDGTPRVVPIWFDWDGAEIVLGSPRDAPKAKALHDGAAVALCIDTDTFPYRSVVVRGTAHVTTVDGVTDAYARAATRYFGAEQGQAWVDGLPDGMEMLRIAVRPEHVTVLDFETRFPSAISGT